MTASRKTTGRWSAVALLTLLAFVPASCGSDTSSSDTSGGASDEGQAETSTEIDGTLTIGAIPDQDPEQLARTYGLVADYLEGAVPGLTVEYLPVTDYQGAVAGFRTGDLDFVWFGGLTGVQARLEVEGANAVAQRDIDAEFTSVFIANTSAGIEPVADVAGLSDLAGTRFTYGSESSTSGRLMPEAFLNEAGIDPATDFDGAVGFSGSHDATIEQVEAGTFQTGALNSQVWDARRAEGGVDDSAVIEVFRTPSYFDYHWVARPEIDDRLGVGATEAVVEALLALDATDPDQAAILALFGANSFIRTDNANYADIEQVGRNAGLINQ